MALEELRKEILRRTFEEVKAIGSQAAQDEKKVLDAADAERKPVLESAKKEAAAVAEAERGERIASARLRARKLLAEQKEAVLAKAVSEVRERFLSSAGSSAYEKLLKRLVAQGVSEAGEGAVITLNARDKKLFKGFKGAKLAEEPGEFSGGAIIESADGRLRIRATLESLFEESVPKVRNALNSAIFGKGKA